MSRTLMTRLMSPEQAVQAKLDAKAELEKIVRGVAGASGVALIVRDLVPSDYGVGATPAATELGLFVNQVQFSATAYVNAFTTDPVLGPQQAWCILGIGDFAAVPTLMEARFAIGASQTFQQVRLAEAWLTGLAAVSISPGVYYKPNETMHVTFLGSAATAASAEGIELIGLVAEPAGKTFTAMDDRPN